MQPKFHYMKFNNKLVPEISETQARQEYLASVPDGTIFVLTIEDKKNKRTSDMNKYLWHLYSYLVPAHFETKELAHEYFVKKYLSQYEVIDLTEENLSNILSKISQYGSNTCLPKIKVNEDRATITWYLSTSKLTKQDFSNYIENVSVELANLGITIISFDF